MTGKTQFLETEGGRIAWQDYAPDSTGPILLMAPGIGSLRQEYRLIAPILAEQGLRPIAMDLRGHGESSTGWSEYTPQAVGRDMIALLRERNAGSAWIMGCSMAAASALWAAVEEPGVVRGIVLTGPSIEDGELTAFQRTAMALLFNGPWRERGWTFFYSTLFPKAKPADLDAYLRGLHANLKEAGRFDAVKAFLAASKSAAIERIPRLGRPALILMGSRDPDYSDPVAKAREWGAALHAEVVILEDSGHYPHVDAPRTSAEAILNWIENTGGNHGA